ncbi:MAG: histidine--tRNA ligase [Acidobacteriota bacterium]|nr:histidine--tRNA ligase [Acidobacteriota bacterium]
MIQAPKGTYDVLPQDMERRRAVERHAERILGAAGYSRVETPVFEATELFARGVGEATDIVQKEMYSFDDGGGRSLTLRPEGTAPVCRAYIEHGMHKLPQPVKLWYLSAFFRAENPQKGRYRQFWQVGAEVIGSDGPETDAELIGLLAELLDAMGVRGARLRLASLGQPETRGAYREELTAYLRAHESGLSAEVLARIDLNPMRAFDASDPGTRRVMAGAPKLLDRLSDDDAAHFAAVRALLDAAGVTYELDPALVRGLDYYTRTLFEFSSDALGAQSGVGGGGRYDRLIEQLGGHPTPGIGWAAGLERILLAAPEQPVAPALVDLLVAVSDRDNRDAELTAFVLASEARRAGLAAQLELTGRSLKSALKHADRIQARYVAIVNDGRQTSLRDMSTGEQRELEGGAVIAAILRGHRL